MTLEELNGALGKQFPDRETAIKSIKDTFSYVGKKVEDIEKEVIAKVQNNEAVTKLTSEMANLRKDMFYKDNPQYADPDVRKIIEGLGANPAEIVQSEPFKNIFTKVQGFNETAKLKTVLESNPRLAVSKDNLSKAAELFRTSSTDKGQTRDQAESLIAGAVRATYQK